MSYIYVRELISPSLVTRRKDDAGLANYSQVGEPMPTREQRFLQNYNTSNFQSIFQLLLNILFLFFLSSFH